jgi:hypothetical protein
LISWKAGAIGAPSRAVRVSGIVNGTMPTYATPSKQSTSSPGGSRAAIAALSTGQCRNPRCRQIWRITRGPGGRSRIRSRSASPTSPTAGI